MRHALETVMVFYIIISSLSERSSWKPIIRTHSRIKICNKNYNFGLPHILVYCLPQSLKSMIFFVNHFELLEKKPRREGLFHENLKGNISNFYITFFTFFVHCGCGQCSYIHVHCAVDVGHDRVWRSNKSNNYFLVRIIAQNEFILNFFNEMLGIEDQNRISNKILSNFYEKYWMELQQRQTWIY